MKEKKSDKLLEFKSHGNFFIKKLEYFFETR